RPALQTYNTVRQRGGKRSVHHAARQQKKVHLHLCKGPGSGRVETGKPRPQRLYKRVQRKKLQTSVALVSFPSCAVCFWAEPSSVQPLSSPTRLIVVRLLVLVLVLVLLLILSEPCLVILPLRHFVIVPKVY